METHSSPDARSSCLTQVQGLERRAHTECVHASWGWARAWGGLVCLGGSGEVVPVVRTLLPRGQSSSGGRQAAHFIAAAQGPLQRRHSPSCLWALWGPPGVFHPPRKAEGELSPQQSGMVVLSRWAQHGVMAVLAEVMSGCAGGRQSRRGWAGTSADPALTQVQEELAMARKLCAACTGGCRKRVCSRRLHTWRPRRRGSVARREPDARDGGRRTSI